MVVQPAVGHQEHLPARHLALDNARDVNARFADEVASELDHDRRLGHPGPGLGDDLAQVGTHRRQVQPSLAGEVGDAETAPQVEEAHRCRRVGGQPLRQRKALALGLADGLGAQVLRAGEQVEALETQALGAQQRHRLGDQLDVQPELLGPAAHLHSRALELEVRVHAQGHPRRQAELLLQPAQDGQLAQALGIDQHAGGHGLAQFGLALAGPGEADVARVGAGVQRHLQLASGRHVDAADQAGHQRDHGRHRVGLHREMQLDLSRQHGLQLGHARAQQAAVVGVERRAADTFGQLRERETSDQQVAAVGASELGHLAVRGRGAGRGGFSHAGASFQSRGRSRQAAPSQSTSRPAKRRKSLSNEPIVAPCSSASAAR